MRTSPPKVFYSAGFPARFCDQFVWAFLAPGLRIMSGDSRSPELKKKSGDSVPTGPKARTWTSLGVSVPTGPKGADLDSLHSQSSPCCPFPCTATKRALAGNQLSVGTAAHPSNEINLTETRVLLVHGSKSNEREKREVF